MPNATAMNDGFLYGLISRKSAEYLGSAPATAGGGVVTIPWTLPVEKPIPESEGGGTWTDQVDGYMAKLPFPGDRKYLLVETDESEYTKAVEEARWLDQCS